MFTKCALIALFATAVIAAPSTNRAQRGGSGLYFGDLKFMFGVYKECAARDLFPCLKLKLVTALDRAARLYDEVSIMEGVTFVKESNGVLGNRRLKSENEIEAELPRSLDERDSALDNMIFDIIGNFLETHTLKVKLPGVNEMQRSAEEGRFKKKKIALIMMVPLLIGGILSPLALGSLTLLAGKALIVSKIAIVLAGILGLKKLLGGGGYDSGHEVVVSGGHSSGWGRAFNNNEAQKLAYRAYSRN